MLTRQVIISSRTLDGAALSPLADLRPDLVLAFGRPSGLSVREFGQALRRSFPAATVAGCSGAGIFSDHTVRDEGCVLTAVKFNSAAVCSIAAPIHSMVGSLETGIELARGLKVQKVGARTESELRAMVVFSQGVQVNGSALIDGIQEVVGRDILIVGGLAGGEGTFDQTWTMLNGESFDRHVVALGFYGSSLKFHHGSASGWDPFGLVRRITLSSRNILFRLDGRPALEVYQEYLSDAAGALPGGALYLPLAMLTENQEDTGIILNVIGFDTGAGSLIMAGDVPENGMIRMMHSRATRLVDAACLAATMSLGSGSGSDLPGSSLGLLFSCAGRKAVLGAAAEDELEAVKSVLGPATLVTGFYSYGQVCPLLDVSDCRLQNQTMTIARIEE